MVSTSTVPLVLDISGEQFAFVGGHAQAVVDKIISIHNPITEANTKFNATMLSGSDMWIPGSDSAVRSNGSGGLDGSVSSSPSRTKYQTKNQCRRDKRAEKTREEAADGRLIQIAIAHNEELGISVASPKSARTKIGTWSPGEEKRLIEYLKRGYDEKQCAEALSRTLQSVRDKFFTSRNKRQPCFQPHDPKAAGEAYDRAMEIKKLLEVNNYYSIQ